MDERGSRYAPPGREIGGPRRRLLFAAILVLAAALLCIGVRRDYRLKHEDNNALYSTIARSHLELGLGTHRGQDLLFNRRAQIGQVYAHHPPGIGLLLAGAMAATGRDGPALVRGVAIGFHLLSLVLLYGLLRRSSAPRSALEFPDRIQREARPDILGSGRRPAPTRKPILPVRSYLNRNSRELQIMKMDLYLF